MSTAPETVLNPEIEIVDPHHHLWDRTHQWATQSTDRAAQASDSDPTGADTEPSRVSEYLLPDLKRDISSSGHAVTGTVYVECGWQWDAQYGDLESVPEVAHVSSISRTSEGSLIQGIVGYSDLRTGSDAGRMLDCLIEAGEGKLVGIRQGTTWHPDRRIPASRTNPGPRLTENETWRRGFAELSSRGLVFDAWVFQTQLKELAALASVFPDATIVIDHLGGPLRVGPFSHRDADAQREWLDGLRACSAQPNMVLKVGALGMPMLLGDREVHNSSELAKLWREPVLRAIDFFGADRCMFESNFPIDRVSCSYQEVWNAFKLISQDMTSREKFQLFAGTARRVYGLK